MFLIKLSNYTFVDATNKLLLREYIDRATTCANKYFANRMAEGKYTNYTIVRVKIDCQGSIIGTIDAH